MLLSKKFPEEKNKTMKYDNNILRYIAIEP